MINTVAIPPTSQPSSPIRRKSYWRYTSTIPRPPNVVKLPTNPIAIVIMSLQNPNAAPFNRGPVLDPSTLVLSAETPGIAAEITKLIIANVHQDMKDKKDPHVKGADLKAVRKAIEKTGRARVQVVQDNAAATVEKKKASDADAAAAEQAAQVAKQLVTTEGLSRPPTDNNTTGPAGPEGRRAPRADYPTGTTSLTGVTTPAAISMAGGTSASISPGLAPKAAKQPGVAASRHISNINRILGSARGKHTGTDK